MSEVLLTEKQQVLLDKHLWFYQQLDSGERRPNTKEQLHFLKVCRNEAPAQTEHEKAYMAWLRKKLIEASKREDAASSHGIPEFEEGSPRSEFGTRTDYLRDRNSWKSTHT